MIDVSNPFWHKMSLDQRCRYAMAQLDVVMAEGTPEHGSRRWNLRMIELEIAGFVGPVDLSASGEELHDDVPKIQDRQPHEKVELDTHGMNRITAAKLKAAGVHQGEPIYSQNRTSSAKLILMCGKLSGPVKV